MLRFLWSLKENGALSFFAHSFRRLSGLLLHSMIMWLNPLRQASFYRRLSFKKAVLFDVVCTCALLFLYIVSCHKYIFSYVLLFLYLSYFPPLKLENVGDCCKAQWVCADERMALYNSYRSKRIALYRTVTADKRIALYKSYAVLLLSEEVWCQLWVKFSFLTCK